MAAQILFPVLQGVITFLNIYMVLLFIRLLLTWFPNIDWSNPALSILTQLTDPYLNLFRNIIPPLGGIDLSGMLAIILLSLLTSAISRAGLTVAAIAYGYIG